MIEKVDKLELERIAAELGTEYRGHEYYLRQPYFWIFFPLLVLCTLGLIVFSGMLLEYLRENAVLPDWVCGLGQVVAFLVVCALAANLGESLLFRICSHFGERRDQRSKTQ